MKRPYPGYRLALRAALLGISLLLLHLPAPLTAQWRMPRAVISCGGADISAGNYAIRGTVGQPIIGTVRGAAYEGFLGFWYDADHAVVGVGQSPPATTDEFRILQLYPNPASGTVTCVFTSPTRGIVRMTLFDVLGRASKGQQVRAHDSGKSAMQLGLEGLKPGLYFLKVEDGASSHFTRLTVMQ